MAQVGRYLDCLDETYHFNTSKKKERKDKMYRTTARDMIHTVCHVAASPSLARTHAEPASLAVVGVYYVAAAAHTPHLNAD